MLYEVITCPEGPRLGLVIPHANGVQHIALTRCWPIDGAENAARRLEARRRARADFSAGGGDPGPAPPILGSGYSQGGAAVRQRLLDLLLPPRPRAPRAADPAAEARERHRITSYNVCYTKLLR